MQHVQQDFFRSCRCHLGSLQEGGSSETRPHCFCSFLPCFSKENLPHLFLVFYLLQLGQFSTTLIVTCINSFITGKSSWTSIILRKVKAETGSVSQKVLQVTDLFVAAALWISLCIKQKRVVLQLCFWLLYLNYTPHIISKTEEKTLRCKYCIYQDSSASRQQTEDWCLRSQIQQ